MDSFIRLSTTECLAQKFQFKVVEISDGFVGLNRDNLQIKFRIWGIDAPEKETGFWDKNQGLFVSPYFWGKILLLMFKNKMVGVDISLMFIL